MFFYKNQRQITLLHEFLLPFIASGETPTRGALCSRVGYIYLGTVLQFNVVCHLDQCYMRNWKEHKP